VERSCETIIEKTAAVIPAYNAGRFVAGVVEKTSEIIPRSRIIVVDDGSTDNTAEEAQRAGAVVTRHALNQGKGVALHTGILEAAEMGMDFAITLDADGQHNPDEIRGFVEKQAATDADIIVGNRMADRGDMPGIRVFANRATSWFLSFRTGTHIPDSQNGYRMIRTSLYKTLKLKAKKYDAESEVLIKGASAGAKIESVPVETIYGSEVSSVNPFIDTLRFLRMAIKSIFW
jgi:glycosyltransferase involved in cell wall biosynthesis